MPYEVLALKYRPKVFEDLVGQETVARTLMNAIQQDRIANAFLFSGVRGVGKTTTARILARALNCQRGPTVRPCGRVRGLRRDRQRRRARRARDRRREQQRRGPGARDRRRLALRAVPRPFQDLHHRRGPHAVDGGVQRALEDARRAAARGEVHLRHDGAPQDPGHHPLAVPGVRVPHRAPGADRGASLGPREVRRHRRVRAGGAHGRPCGGREASATASLRSIRSSRRRRGRSRRRTSPSSWASSSATCSARRPRRSSPRTRRASSRSSTGCRGAAAISASSRRRSCSTSVTCSSRRWPRACRI